MVYTKVDLCPHLKVLHRLFQLFCFSRLKLNRSRRRVQPSLIRSIVSRAIFYILRITCLTLFAFLVNWGLIMPGHTYVDAQDITLMTACILFRTLGIWMSVQTYMTLGHTMAPIINEMFKVFALLEKKTDSKMYFSSEVELMVWTKIISCYLCTISDFLSFAETELFAFYKFICPYSETLRVFTFLGHLYSQLVLICFYKKMDNFLQVGFYEMDKEEFTRNVQDLLAISFRIHRLKRDLNRFFSIPFLSIILGIFPDVENAYSLLTTLLYMDLGKKSMVWMYFMSVQVNWQLVSMVRVPFELYIIGLLSDMLTDSENVFKEKIYLLVSRNSFKWSKSFDWEVEQFLFRSQVYGLRTWALKVIDMSIENAFAFVLGAMFVFVMSFVQYYASTEVYT